MEKPMVNELIKVVSLPQIEERVHALKSEVDRRVSESISLVCTEETVQSVKERRTGNRKLTAYIKEQLRQAEEALLAPFNFIKEYCKKELIAPLEALDEQQKKAILEVEYGVIKARCEERLRDYFAELCAVHHVEWLRYEQAGIKVDMASAKAKTPTKLRNQLLEFVVRVSNDVTTIAGMEDAVELLVEYKACLDFAEAFGIVQDRTRRKEAEQIAVEQRQEVLKQEAEAVRRVEVLATPTVIEEAAEKKTIIVSLVMHPTKEQYESQIKPIIKQLKEICEKEGISYE